MLTSNLDTALRAVIDLSHTAIVFYFIYSVRVYLTARLEKFGVEKVFEARGAAPQEEN